MNFQLVEHFLATIASVLSADAIVKVIEKVWEILRENTTPGDIRKVRLRIFKDMSAVDEHIYDMAEQRLEPVLRQRLRERLATTLSSYNQNYFRIIMLGDIDPTDEDEVEQGIERMAQSMRQHALESPGAWENYKKIMDLDKEPKPKDEHRIQTLLNALGRNIKLVVQELYSAGKQLGIDLYDAAKKLGGDCWNTVKPILDQTDAETDRWATNAQSWINTGSVMTSARRINQQRQTRSGWKRFFGI